MLEIHPHFKLFLRSLTRLVYPATCIACKTLIYIQESHLCRPCARKIQFLSTSACTRCARPFPPFGHHDTLCPICQSKRPYYTRGYALTAYDGPVKEMLNHVKFRQKPWLLHFFKAHIHAFSCVRDFQNYDMIVPVPMDRLGQRKRGFNQAMLIARMVAGVSTPLKAKPILSKPKHTKPQSSLHKVKRLQNVTHAFKLKGDPQLEGKRILLVDDIMTTGSTLNACAKVLLSKGAAQVDFFTLARTLNK